MRKDKIEKLKRDCPDCCNFNLVITPENCLSVKQKQAAFLSVGKKISFELALNKIISEHRFAKENGAIIT